MASKYRKPLNIFSILENEITSTDTVEETQRIIGLINELSQKYDLDSLANFEEAKAVFSEEDFAKGVEVREYDNKRSNQKRTFNLDYKNSLRKLFKEHGLPVHINAFDIHRMNIDIENIDNLIEAQSNKEGFRTVDFFTDDTWN